MSKLLISTEHFGFVLSIFIFLLSVEIPSLGFSTIKV